MGKEIDLLKNYPKTKRNTSERAIQKTNKDREIARRFDKEFFDGERSHGYGGFTRNLINKIKFWSAIYN